MSASFSVQTKKPDDSRAWSGNYEILKCNAGQPNSMASKLQIMLPKITSILLKTITDTKKGTASTYGYSAIFKTNDNIRTVQTVYRNIVAGNPVDKKNSAAKGAGLGYKAPPSDLAKPGIVCVQEGDPQTAEYLRICNLSGAQYLIAAVAGQYIILCPAFWRLPTTPDIRTCPKVRRNTLMPNNERLVLNQQSQLIHELAHLYGIGGGPGSSGRNWRTGEYEPIVIRDNVALNAKDSANNAQSYAYYFAANAAGCTSWPQMELPDDLLRHLLGHGAADNATRPADILEIANVTSPFGS